MDYKSKAGFSVNTFHLKKNVKSCFQHSDFSKIRQNQSGQKDAAHLTSGNLEKKKTPKLVKLLTSL